MHVAVQTMILIAITNPPPSSTTQIGVLTDGPVTGVKYLRASSSGESIEGITNDKGAV